MRPHSISARRSQERDAPAQDPLNRDERGNIAQPSARSERQEELPMRVA
jgi:hypothetical protein